MGPDDTLYYPLQIAVMLTRLLSVVKPPGVSALRPYTTPSSARITTMTRMTNNT